MSGDINNTQEILDSRNVIERFQELEDILEAAGEPEATDAEREEWADVAEEHTALAAFVAQGEDYEEWTDGATLVHEEYFESYAKELAEETGIIDSSHALYTYVDWESWADGLKEDDYEAINFDGVDYYIRGN